VASARRFDFDGDEPSEVHDAPDDREKVDVALTGEAAVAQGGPATGHKCGWRRKRAVVPLKQKVEVLRQRDAKSGSIVTKRRYYLKGCGF
jgi:hypothetical protein